MKFELNSPANQPRRSRSVTPSYTPTYRISGLSFLQVSTHLCIILVVGEMEARVNMIQSLLQNYQEVNVINVLYNNGPK